MKETKKKLLQIRVDSTFIKKVNYLRHLNGYKTTSETIRKVIEKEYRKEI